MPKRLIVCCDGTWNRPDELNDGVPAPTNVSKLALAVAREDAAPRRRSSTSPGSGRGGSSA